MFKFIKKVNIFLKTNGVKKFFIKALLFLLIKFLEIKRNLKFFVLKLFSKKENNFLIKNVNDSKMYLNAKDVGLSRDLFLDGVREPIATKAVKKIIKKGDIVVDIGGNIGYYALLESRLVGEEGKVFAIEPVPDNFEVLNKNIELNKYKNITTYRYAIGDEDGNSEINVGERRNSSSLREDVGGYVKFIDKVPVKVFKLDTFLKDKPSPSFVRMDVEGYETEIIKGMEKTLSSSKKLKVFIELHSLYIGEVGVENLVKIFEKNNFTITKVIKGRSSLIVSEPKFIQNLFNKLQKYFGYDECDDLGKSHKERRELIKQPYFFHVLFERS